MIDILGIQSFSFEETATVFKVTGRRTIQIFLHSCIINMKHKQLFNRKKLMFQCVWRRCFAYVRSSVTNISTCFNLYFVKSVRIRSLLIFFSLMNTQAQNCWYGSVCAFDQNFVRFFWSVFCRIPNEYGYSVRIWENADQKKLHICAISTQCFGFWYTVKAASK